MLAPCAEDSRSDQQGRGRRNDTKVSINTKVSIDTIVQYRRIRASVVMPRGL
jgi:hypothetical protein